MSKDVSAALTRCLQELRLATVRNQYEAVARQATAETWSYGDFLLELLQRECQQRQHNRIERLRKASRLHPMMTAAAIDRLVHQSVIVELNCRAIGRSRRSAAGEERRRRRREGGRRAPGGVAVWLRCAPPAPHPAEFPTG